MGRQLLFAFSLFALSANAQEYTFCVISEQRGVFKAEVLLTDLDLGRWAARSMLQNELNAHLREGYSLSAFDPARCACRDTCRVLEVRAEDWDGNWSDNELGLESALGAITEVGNKLMGEGRALWRNPGGYLVKRLFKR